MDKDRVERLLRQLVSGKVSVEHASRELSMLPFSVVEGTSGHAEARVDGHRSLRCGFPEVVFCQGKSAEQVVSISRSILEHSDVLLATRADQSQYQALAAREPDARWYEQARLIVIDRREERPAEGHVLVASAGTADMAVAEEAALCSEVMGAKVTRLYDVGVAGVHRLFAHQELLRSARCIVAVAGMEGALPSVVAGMVDVPVVAVPTSVGYGANFGGVAALLTMLNSCAGGIAVMNIDNGFGAAVFATRVNSPAWVKPE